MRLALIALAAGAPGIYDALVSQRSALLSNERRPVKTLLSEFNAQRMIGKMIKGAHRRLSTEKPPSQLPA